MLHAPGTPGQSAAQSYRTSGAFASSSPASSPASPATGNGPVPAGRPHAYANVTLQTLGGCETGQL